jgi:NAD(P) transhydrogenase subunit alpha
MFTGFEVITKVPPLLHTPLMSGSNAISGISVVGALVITAAAAGDPVILALGVVAVAMGMINVAGGFLVTDRMLEMFRKKPTGEEAKS